MKKSQHRWSYISQGIAGLSRSEIICARLTMRASGVGRATKNDLIKQHNKLSLCKLQQEL